MTFVSESSTYYGAGSQAPVFDYTSRDYASIYADLLARIPLYLPEWTSNSDSDFGIVLLQMFAYVGDLLGYYLDRLGGEAFLQTATQPQSILNIAAMLGYTPSLAVGSTVSLQITISSSSPGDVTIPAGSQFSTVGSTTTPAVVFTTVQPITIPGVLAATPVYTGTVLAFQGYLVANEAVGTSTGTINQVFQLQQSPVAATVPTPLVAVLAQQLNNGQTYTSISVQPTGAQINGGDVLVLTNAAGTATISISVASTVAAGSTVIPTSSFVANAVYAAGLILEDITSVGTVPGFTVYVDLGLGPVAWTYVTTLVNSGPTAQVFTYVTDANGNFYIVFGDNVNGFVPPLGSPITCSYYVTAGAQGNVGAGTIALPVTAISGVSAVTNPASAAGGSNAESTSSIAANAPLSLRALNRGVTPQDIASLGLQVSGVQWANTSMQTYQLIYLYVAPTGAGILPAALASAVSNYLSGLVMANATVTVLGPAYVVINLTVAVTIAPSFGNTATQQAILAALQSLLNFDATGFAYRISISLIYSTILAVSGVLYANISALGRGIVCYLRIALTNNTVTSTLSVTALPSAMAQGDTILMTDINSGYQEEILVGTGGAAQGATSIPVTAIGGGSWTTHSAYGVSSEVEDITGTTGVADAVLLANEIPIAGVLKVTVTGGVPGS